MTRHYDDRGKVLIVGGGIANFTDVAASASSGAREQAKAIGPIKATKAVKAGQALPAAVP